MYSFETIFEGIKFTVYLFSGFTGIIQPFVPENPITADEIYSYIEKYDGTNYVQGWYINSKTGPRLVRIKKVFLISQNFEIKTPVSRQPGSHYHCLIKGNQGVEIGREITAIEAIHETHYLRYAINQQGELESSLHIYNNAWDIYNYEYNEQGALINRKIEIRKPPAQIPDL